MIAIKNADGTLVPVIDSRSGMRRRIPLSLVSQQQKRADIQIYEIPDGVVASHVRDVPDLKPIGTLHLRKLPENTFGELEIDATIWVEDETDLCIQAEAEGMKPVRSTFKLPSLHNQPGDLPETNIDDWSLDGLDGLEDDQSIPDSTEEISIPALDEEQSSVDLDDDFLSMDEEPLVLDESLDIPNALESTETPQIPMDDDIFELGNEEFAPFDDISAEVEPFAQNKKVEADEFPTFSMDEESLFDEESLKENEDLPDFGPDIGEDEEIDASMPDFADEADSIEAQTVFSGFDYEEETIAEPAATQVTKPAKREQPTNSKLKPVAADRPKPAKTQRKQQLSGGVGQVLLRASIGLFAISLIELLIFIGLRIHLI